MRLIRAVGTELVGTRESTLGRLVAGVLVLYVAMFLNYFLGVVTINDGGLFVPDVAILGGVLVAILFGFDRYGVFFAWFAVFASLLGAHSPWNLLSRTEHFWEIPGQIATTVLTPDALGYLSVAALLFAIPAYVIGRTLGWAIERWSGPVRSRVREVI